jgi:hypothetical protein
MEVGRGDRYVVDRGGAVGRAAFGAERRTSGIEVDDGCAAGSGEPGSRIAEIRTRDLMQTQHFGIETNCRVEIVGLDGDMEEIGNTRHLFPPSRGDSARR